MLACGRLSPTIPVNTLSNVKFNVALSFVKPIDMFENQNLVNFHEGLCVRSASDF